MFDALVYLCRFGIGFLLLGAAFWLIISMLNAVSASRDEERLGW